MKNINITNKSLVCFAVCLITIFIFSSAAFAQVKLRSALDYDGDGKADFSVFRGGSENAWFVSKSNGSGVIGSAFGSSNTDTLAPGDYDGDGKGDLAVWRYTNGTFYYLASGTNTYQARQFGTIGDEIVQRDYDGDGKTDFAVVRRASNVMYWYVLNSQTNTTSGVQFGAASDAAVPGDYDGDGKFDIAVQRSGGTSNASTFYILGSTSGFYGAQFGLGSDMVATGDYDGDAKTDIAVARKNSGNLTWYILRSSNSQLQAYNFGAAETDSIVQNDYDGDGKTDAAVWRETNGTFYILKSTDGNLSAAQWGYSTDLPVAAYDTH